MDEAARRILCKDVAEHDFIHLNLFYSFDCLIYYKKDVTYKMLKTIMQGMMGTEHCTAEMEEEISQNVLSKIRMWSGIIATKQEPSWMSLLHRLHLEVMSQYFSPSLPPRSCDRSKLQ